MIMCLFLLGVEANKYNAAPDPTQEANVSLYSVPHVLVLKREDFSVSVLNQASVPTTTT
jgi:hypothetical protein